MSQTDDDLDLLSVDQLVGALARRFDSVVFGGCTRLSDGTTDYSVRTSGNQFEAIGLAHYLAYDLSTQVQHDEQTH